MTQNRRGLDQGFLRAYSNQRTATSSTAAGVTIGQDLSVKVSVSASTDQVIAAFDPVAATRERATRQLNQVAKLGYRLPKSVTR